MELMELMLISTWVSEYLCSIFCTHFYELVNTVLFCQAVWSFSLLPFFVRDKYNPIGSETKHDWINRS